MKNERMYIAYGSNLNKAQMMRRCPTARLVGTAEIEGYELLFKGSRTGAYLTIEPGEGGKVPVGIWAIRPMDELRLDCYEGYPDFYCKKDFELDVKTADGVKRMPCFAYIMDESRPLGEPSMYYVGVCLDGYRDFGFDQMEVWDAIERTQKRRNG